jgi:hypothetical protein
MTMRAVKFMCFGVLGMLAAGCGGDDDKGSNGGGASYQDITESLAEPSGTVDSDTAGDIGEEFEKVSEAAPAGIRDDQVAQSNGSYSQPCDGGGTISASGSGSESSGNVSFSYDNCCTAGCCIDGAGSLYYSTDTSAAFSYCGNYDIDFTCDGSSSSANFSGCAGTNGEWVYRIEVAGETYAVSGSYSNGNGELEIRGANGTFNCTYTNGSGSCTGSGGSFSFSS